MKDGLRIGEVAARTGLTTKAIRYYESLGLLRPPKRTFSGYRNFGEEEVERLSFIKKAKSLGFSLEEARDTLAIYDTGRRPCVHVVALLDRKIEEVGQWIKELQGFQKGLMELRLRAETMRGKTDGESICGIVDQVVHIKGQEALTWLESRRRG